MEKNEKMEAAELAAPRRAPNILEQEPGSGASEEAPRKGEGKLLLFLESVIGQLQAGIAILQGRELRYTLVNATYQAIRPDVPMVGRTYREVFPEPSAAGAEEAMRRLLDSGGYGLSYGYLAPLPGKPEAAWDHRIIRLPVEAGEEPAILVSSWEVTEHKRLEEKLRHLTEKLLRARQATRESEERLQQGAVSLQLAIESTELGTFDYYPQSGELYWSDLAKLHFGLPAGAEINYDVFLSGLHPDDRERVHRLLQDALRPGGGIYRTEYRTIGIEDHKERWLSAQGRVFFDDKQQPQRLIGATIDITERKRTEEALKLALAEADEGRRILEAMMEHIPMGVAIADAPGRRIRLVSRYGMELSGKTREEVENIPVDQHVERWQILRPDGTPADFDELPLTRATLEGEIILEEEWLLGGAGRQIPILCTAAPIRDHAGHITGGVIGWQDISTRKRNEQERERLIAELERSNRELQQFAYVSSHDLQEPLRTVTNFVELLALRYRGKLDADADRYIGYVVEGTNRMSRLINDLLAYSQVMTRNRPFAPVAMNEVVDKVVLLLQAALEERSAEVSRDNLPVVTGDETQLAQLMQNLIGNAVKFTRAGVLPRVRITADRKGGDWIFGVHDNGIGVEERFHERIFVIFQRLHTREEYPGTGIGLALCRKIAERHGGRIWIDSTPGEGSTFYFALPGRESRPPHEE